MRASVLFFRRKFFSFSTASGKSSLKTEKLISSFHGTVPPNFNFKSNPRFQEKLDWGFQISFLRTTCKRIGYQQEQIGKNCTCVDSMWDFMVASILLTDLLTHSLEDVYRFHVLSEFDEGKRSCRRRLAGHNERRRKPQPDAMALSHSRFSASLYEDRRLGNILMDRSQFMHPRIASSSALGNPIDFRLGHAKGTWPRMVKLEDQVSFDGELQIPASDRHPYASALTRHNAEKLLLFLQSSKTAPGEALSQGIHQYVSGPAGHVDQALTLTSSSRTGLSGIDVASATHGLSGVSDSGRALSLLSSHSLSSSAPGTTSFDIATQDVTMDQLIYDDRHLIAQPLVQGVQHNFADKLLTLCSQSSASLIPSGFPATVVNSMSKERQGESLISTVSGIGTFEGHMFGMMQGNNFRGSQAANSHDIQCTIDLMSTQTQTDDCQTQSGMGNQGSRHFTDFQALRAYESSVYDSPQML